MSEHSDGTERQRRSEKVQHVRAVLDDLRAQREAVQIAEQARTRAAAQERQAALLAFHVTAALTA